MARQNDLLYRNFHVYYDPPPIPTREFDWHCYHDDYDGAPDAGDNRAFHGPSLWDISYQIDQWYEDQLNGSMVAKLCGVIDFCFKYMPWTAVTAAKETSAWIEAQQALNSAIDTNDAYHLKTM